jgi:predicted MFS family arabinose efflux permease
MGAVEGPRLPGREPIATRRTAGDFGGRASGSYLTAYYLGSAVLAAMSGLIYQQAGWPITALALIALIAAALLAIASAPPS